MKFVGLVNSAQGLLTLLKCALYTEEKSTIEAKKKKKKKKKENAKHECTKVNPNRTLESRTSISNHILEERRN